MIRDLSWHPYDPKMVVGQWMGSREGRVVQLGLASEMELKGDWVCDEEWEDVSEGESG